MDSAAKKAINAAIAHNKVITNWLRDCSCACHTRPSEASEFDDSNTEVMWEDLVWGHPNGF
jgi:hypothetical protein